jgi:hypothetical protein
MRPADCRPSKRDGGLVITLLCSEASEHSRKTGAVSSPPRKEQRAPFPVSGRASAPFALTIDERSPGGLRCVSLAVCCSGGLPSLRGEKSG